MSNYIVNVAVSQLVAPAPSTLQRTGAFISQGGSTLAANSTALITQMSDLTAILAGSIAVTSMSWSASVVTVTLAGPHGIPVGDTVLAVIAGVTPAGYNGTVSVTYTGANTFTYPLVSNPGSVTVQGTFTLEDVQELVAMGTTFFAQGNDVAVYVLELGTGTPAQGVTALTAYIANPTLQFYRYLLPTTWGSESTAQTLANNNSGTTKLLYFHPTVTLANYSGWKTYKSVVMTIQSPTAPVTEFDAAVSFYRMLALNPTNVNLMTPLAFDFAYGVTAYNPSPTTATTLKANFINFIDTGAEGGITNTLIKWGTDAVGNDATYWYAADWVNLNCHLALANAIINGANNPQNPLYYNQAGINRLQQVAQSKVNSGVSFGLVSGTPVVTAIPFTTYTQANPSDYPLGIYNGLAVTFTPNRGFTSITFYLTVSNFAAS